MEKDSISYINVVAKDSIVMHDSINQHLFAPEYIGGDMAQLVDQQMHSSVYTNRVGGVSTLRYDGQPLPFNMEQIDGVFGLLLLCFLFFAHIYNGGISFLKDNISLLFSFNKNQRIHKQTTAKEILYGYFLLFQSMVLISICIYDVFVEYNFEKDTGQKPLITIITFIVLISLFLGVKDFIFKIVGYIFDQQKLVFIWRRTHTLSLEILGILYFVPTLLLIYSNYYHSYILAFMLIVFIMVQITLFYQIIVFFVNQKFNFLYLIAYLCTFEILPYIFLSIGLIYLYRIDVFNILWP